MGYETKKLNSAAPSAAMAPMGATSGKLNESNRIRPENAKREIRQAAAESPE